MKYYIIFIKCIFLLYFTLGFEHSHAQKYKIESFFISNKWELNYSLDKIPIGILNYIQKIQPDDSLLYRIVPFDSFYAWEPNWRKSYPNNRLLFWGKSKKGSKVFICCQSLSLPAIQITVFYFDYSKKKVNNFFIFKSIKETVSSFENMNLSYRPYDFSDLIDDIKYVKKNPALLKFMVSDSLDIYGEGPVDPHY